MNGGNASTTEFDLRTEAQQFLRPGEQPLWVARPDYRQFTKLQWPLVGFGLFWSAITFTVSGGFIHAMFFAKSVHGNFPKAAQPLILLFFVPFWAVSFFMLGGHKLVAQRQWRKMLYALTNQNIIIRTGKSEVRLDHDAVKNVQIDRLRNGLGTVRFLGGTAGPVTISAGKFNFQIPAAYQSTGTASANQSLCFQAIADPDGFVQLAQKLLAAKPSPTL
jgi:hypothetical protein